MILINNIYFNENEVVTADPETGYVHFTDGSAWKFNTSNFKKLLGIETVEDVPETNEEKKEIHRGRPRKSKE